MAEAAAMPARAAGQGAGTPAIVPSDIRPIVSSASSRRPLPSAR